MSNRSKGGGAAVAAPPFTHVVLRPFRGAGADRVRDELVAASAWRTAPALVDSRFLRELKLGEAPEVHGCQCGRLFAQAAAVGRHGCPDAGSDPASAGDGAPAPNDEE